MDTIYYGTRKLSVVDIPLYSDPGAFAVDAVAFPAFETWGTYLRGHLGGYLGDTMNVSPGRAVWGVIFSSAC